MKINKLGLKAAAKKYCVPKLTLEVKLKNPCNEKTCGPWTILTLRDELQLVKRLYSIRANEYPSVRIKTCDNISKSHVVILTDG